MKSILSLIAALACSCGAAAAKPNVVLIYADDIGYGDLSCYGATRVSTPNLDALAAAGLKFSDGHSSAATCTPSRYAMLTGEYAWRKPGTGIARGDAALIIEPGRTTLASIMKAAGYATGVVGKWHLGLGDGDLDWNGEIKPGPLELGFDYAFLVPATGDRVPCVYVEDRHVVGLDPDDPIRVSFGPKVGDLPTGRERPDLLKVRPSHGHDQTIINGISRIGTMSGGRAAWWVDEDMADTLTNKGVEFINRHKSEPFFLYFSTHDIHVPRVPHPRFVGKSSMGPRGDAIVQLDWCVGELVRVLTENGLLDNTLILFTSDNGPVIDDGYRDEAVEKLDGHRPAGPYRGGKYSNFEGGTRVPWIVHWPAEVKPGSSDALVSQVDLPASFATLTGQELPQGAAPDSEDVTSALLGRSERGRDTLVEQAGVLSLRQGTWKYIEPGKGPRVNRNTDTELGNDPDGQLYDLATDPGERTNLAAEMPDRAKRMAETLKSIRERGGVRR